MTIVAPDSKVRRVSRTGKVSRYRVATLAVLRMYQKRADVLNDELARVAGTKPVETLHREDFLHCYLEAFRATIHTHREEKIRLFARLLASTIEGADLADVDEFEELLGVLDELSFREIRFLAIFDRARAEQREKDTFWTDIGTLMFQHLGLNDRELLITMSRLGRSGL